MLLALNTSELRHDSVYLTCSKKLTGSPLSLPLEILDKPSDNASENEMVVRYRLYIGVYGYRIVYRSVLSVAPACPVSAAAAMHGSVRRSVRSLCSQLPSQLLFSTSY